MAAFVLRRYDGEHSLPECVIERHSDLTPGVMVRQLSALYSSKSFPSFKASLGLSLDNAHPHVAKTIRDFCSAQHMQLLPWSAYSPNMSPIEHVWDLVGWRLARDPRPAASKD
ncbi:transposable element Tcb2 transposase [Trichonephila clavipes]|nr:transposable element Tcb2 transposase [Trichonephila clavipes]